MRPMSKFPLVCVCVCVQMDVDGSTTDASQLGITGEYMASGHYVLQSQEGKEKISTKYNMARV